MVCGLLRMLWRRHRKARPFPAPICPSSSPPLHDPVPRPRRTRSRRARRRARGGLEGAAERGPPAPPPPALLLPWRPGSPPGLLRGGEPGCPTRTRPYSSCRASHPSQQIRLDRGGLELSGSSPGRREGGRGAGGVAPPGPRRSLRPPEQVTKSVPSARRTGDRFAARYLRRRGARAGGVKGRPK